MLGRQKQQANIEEFCVLPISCETLPCLVSGGSLSCVKKAEIGFGLDSSW